MALDRFAPRVPGPLLAVAAAIAASAVWNFAGHGIGVIGPIAGGLPQLGFPAVRWKEIESLIPVAGSCFVMIVAQSAATARIYAVRHHQRQDENADLAGLAVANAAAALSGTFVVNGSPTQTAMAERSGGRSQMTHVAAAAVVSLVLLFLTGPFQYLPRCVLGAIVFIVAIHLTDLRGLRAIREESPGEFWLAVTTAAVVVLVGVEQGILLAMVVSLLRIVHHSYRPHTAVLMQAREAPGNDPAVPGAATQPGLVVYRFGAALFYANAEMFADEDSRVSSDRAFAGALAHRGCGRHYKRRLHRRAGRAGTPAGPDASRCWTRFRARRIGPAAGPRPTPPHRGHRPAASFRHPARSAQGLPRDRFRTATVRERRSNAAISV